MITRTDVLAHLEASVRTGALKGSKGYTPIRSVFTREHPSDGAYEEYTDMGDPPWPVQGAGKQGDGGTDGRTGSEEVNRMNAGGSIRVVGGEERSLKVNNLDWYTAIGIKHNAINDDRAGDLENWARSSLSQFEKHKDYECFRALNTGAAATFGNGYDGLTFFNDSHLDPDAEYQTAQDNSYALALSLDNYETVKVAGAAFKGSRGQPVGLNHNLLIVPPDLERTAFQISANREAYDTANREANPYAGATNILVAPGGWLDATAWFAIDNSIDGSMPINLQVRQQPRLVMWDDETQEDAVRYFKIHARYTVFFGDWRTAIQGNT